MTRVFDRQFFVGTVFIAVIALVIAATVAQYNGTFRSSVDVTVETDRAGLTLAAGAPVKLRGVEVGTVGSVRPDGDMVEIMLELDPDAVDSVPADVRAQIVPPTAFGAKYLQLTAPADSSAGPIGAGDVIAADHVTVEVDEAFTHLTGVLDAARPGAVSQALTAVAGAVNGRGEVIGDLITQIDAYLASFNPSLTTLSADIRSGTDVLETYDAALPDLLRTADAVTTTTATLDSQQATLHAFLISLNAVSQDASGLVRNTRAGLRRALTLLEPVSRVLAKYSPELPCVVLGLASANRLAEAAVGGTNPGVTTITTLVPGDDPYTYPNNLPVVGETRGPACYGLPEVSPEEARQAPPVFRTGANPHAGPDETPEEDLSSTLFGLLAGVENLR